MDRSFAFKTITTSRSLTYHYHYSPARSKPTILFCHGWPDSAELWSALSSSLVEQGYGAIVPDMLGYGETSKPTDPALYNIRAISNDLIEIVDNEGLDKVIPLGHDWGSHAASRVVLWHPERVCGMILCNVGYFPPGPFELEAFLAGLKQAMGSEIYAYWRLYAAPEGYKLMDAKIESLCSIMYPKDYKIMKVSSSRARRVS